MPDFKSVELPEQALALTNSAASPASEHHAHRNICSPVRPVPDVTGATSNQSNGADGLPPPFRPARYFPPMVDSSDEEEWTQDRIDDEFPLGDGDAETEAFVECPYCGETNEVTLDPGSGTDQEYVEDCQVCCRPWLMHVRYSRDGSADIEVIRSDS